MDTTKLKTDKEIRGWMSEKGKNLKVHHFTKQVKIEHGDDSIFFFPLATIKEDKLRIYIWTEHTGYFYFYKEDLAEIKTKAISKRGDIITTKEKTITNTFHKELTIASA